MEFCFDIQKINENKLIFWPYVNWSLLVVQSNIKAKFNTFCFVGLKSAKWQLCTSPLKIFLMVPRALGGV